MDTCVVSRKNEDGLVIADITVDDFLILANNDKLIDQFYATLAQKYIVKRLGVSKEFLGWSLSKHHDGVFTLSQPALIQTTLANERMQCANGRAPLFKHADELHSPTDDDVTMHDTATLYRQLVGDPDMVITYHGTPLSWASRKQAIMAMSTTEAEYVALASAAQHLHILKKLYVETTFIKGRPVTLNSDTIAVCSMIENPRGTKPQKFIDLRHHLVQQLIRQNNLIIWYVPSTTQKANMLPKAMQRIMFQRQCINLNIGTAPTNRGDTSGKDTRPVSTGALRVRTYS